MPAETKQARDKKSCQIQTNPGSDSGIEWALNRDSKELLPLLYDGPNNPEYEPSKTSPERPTPGQPSPNAPDVGDPPGNPTPMKDPPPSDPEPSPSQPTPVDARLYGSVRC